MMRETIEDQIDGTYYGIIIILAMMSNLLLAGETISFWYECYNLFD